MLDIWNSLKEPPRTALKEIGAGRLKGMTDISPQWRYFAMTEKFGPVGLGWKFTIDKQWIDDGFDGVKCANTNVSLYIKVGGEWSDAIPGTGGSTFVAKESRGMHTSDEAYKMSLTDALSVAMKTLGVAANIYSGNQDYTKYTSPKIDQHETVKTIDDNQLANIESLISEVGADYSSFCKFLKIDELHNLPSTKYDHAITMLEKKRGQ